MSKIPIHISRIIGALRHETDYMRWADPKSRSLDSSWELRTNRAAALVPKHSCVIEFGAGNRLLEKYLHPSCTYVPSDIVDRGPGTIICDLNQRPLPDLGTGIFDVAVLMGVLEYVRDVPSLFDWLAEHVSVCVVSYACAKANGYPLRGKLQTVGRLNMGWLNSYSEDELWTLFQERGFALLREDSWKKQRLFLFSRRPQLEV